MHVVKITDGLGNQMFQYAFAKKLEIITGKKIYLDIRYINNEDRSVREGTKSIFEKKSDRRTYGLDYFRIRLPEAGDGTLSCWNFLKCENKVDKTLFEASKRQKWFFRYLNESQVPKAELVENAHKNLPIYFEGYFFDKTYYDDIRDVLQRDFRPKAPIKLSSQLKEILNSDETVSIHIRRGDFLKLNRDISEKGYYDDAIKRMSEFVENPKWLIFSDDIAWVKANMAFPGDAIYVSEMGYKDYEELTIMKHCKHNIIANSTFSYWAAYLNDNNQKVVICPKNWKPGIVSKEWIRV